MKIVRFNENRMGVTDGRRVVDVTALVGGEADAWPPVSMNRLIRNFDELRGGLAEALAAGPHMPFENVALRAPIPWPNKLIAFPVNYHDHAAEMDSKGLASIKGFFLKANSSLSGASESIKLPDLPHRQIHHECELAIIIGKEGRQITVEHSLDHVFGYACLIDVTVRGKEERVMRKSYDTFTPMGPWIVTADEVQDPSNLDLKLWVNGGLRQDANTCDLIVGIREMVSLSSSVSTLYPGDIIATGTPAGVDVLAAGDVVRIEIEKVGAMEVPVTAGARGRNQIFDRPYEFQRAPLQGVRA